MPTNYSKLRRQSSKGRQEILNHAPNHAGFGICPELNVVQDRVQGMRADAEKRRHLRMGIVDCGMGIAEREMGNKVPQTCQITNHACAP